MVSQADILNARILVVDDQAANVLLLEGMLRIAKYTSVESTTDPTQVCELHRNSGCDLAMGGSKPALPDARERPWMLITSYSNRQ